MHLGSSAKKGHHEPSSSTSAASPESHDNVFVVKERSGHILYGQEFSGGSGGQKTTSGHLNTYIKLPSDPKPCSALKKVQVWKRSKLLGSTASLIAGGTEEDEMVLYVQLFRTRR